jgi:hypothetical protein
MGRVTDEGDEIRLDPLGASEQMRLDPCGVTAVAHCFIQGLEHRVMPPDTLLVS